MFFIWNWITPFVFKFKKPYPQIVGGGFYTTFRYYQLVVNYFPVIPLWGIHIDSFFIIIIFGLLMTWWNLNNWSSSFFKSISSSNSPMLWSTFVEISLQISVTCFFISCEVETLSISSEKKVIIPPDRYRTPFCGS